MAEPTFFFSHARLDTEAPGNYLSRFFEDLELRISQLAQQGQPPFGTIDRRIPHGADWDGVLSNALRHNNAFLAMLTPTYGQRINCGKELGAFLLRSSTLGVDGAGQLTGVSNVLPIRWMSRELYAANNENDALIPRAIRRLEDVPAESSGDPVRARAIQQYRRYGMESFLFKRSRSYSVMLDLLAQRIVNFPTLPPNAGAVEFATAIDAFKHDWAAHFPSQEPPQSAAVPPAAIRASALRPLDTVVVFHFTARVYQPSVVSSDFAAVLVAEPDADPKAVTDPVFASLLSDLRAAGFEEKISLFNAVSPSDRLELDLKSLSKRGVLVLVVLDQAVAPADPLQHVLRSTAWRGAIVRTAQAGPTSVAGEYELPEDRQERRALLSKILVSLRGVALRAGDSRTADAETLPLLKSAG